MPVISRFYGITIRMNFRDSEHNPPHIHVTYGDQECVVDLETCTRKQGKIPARAFGMVIEWTCKNQPELLEMWNSGNITKLPPLE